jgi:peptide-methionine (S)-S-oxide reductase
MKTEKATFGAGCFWGVEEIFRKMSGVISTRVGYTGGTMMSPTYEDVCSDTTGHAEAVQIEYDPEKISYEQLLEVFWSNHNPTTWNRQGPDVGSQYRSVIFFHTPEQKQLAQHSKEELQKRKEFEKRQIVTQIIPAETFYPAEDYHQKYLMKRGLENCHI